MFIVACLSVVAVCGHLYIICCLDNRVVLHIRESFNHCPSSDLPRGTEWMVCI